MTAIGWSALGALGTKVAAQSIAVPQLLAYTTEAIAVYAAVTALVALAKALPHQVRGPEGIPASGDKVVMLRQQAEKMLFAESRRRLLALAQTLDRPAG